MFNGVHIRTTVEFEGVGHQNVVNEGILKALPPNARLRTGNSGENRAPWTTVLVEDHWKFSAT